MEVAARDDQAAAGRDRGGIGSATGGEDERVVGGAVDLDQEDRPEVVERVPDGAMDLRHAAQRVRVLDLVGVAVVAGLEGRVAEQVAHLGRDGDLAGMGPGELVLGGEGHVRAEQRLDRQRRRDARRPGQPIGIGQGQGPDRRHHLGAVEERQALLRLERERLEAGLAQGEQGRHALAVELDLAPPDQGQGQVGERRQVARRAERALLGHDRMDPGRQHLEQALDHDRPAAAVAQGQGVRPEEEHRPDDLGRERRPDAPRRG